MTDRRLAESHDAMADCRAVEGPSATHPARATDRRPDPDHRPAMANAPARPRHPNARAASPRVSGSAWQSPMQEVETATRPTLWQIFAWRAILNATSSPASTGRQICWRDDCFVLFWGGSITAPPPGGFRTWAPPATMMRVHDCGNPRHRHARAFLRCPASAQRERRGACSTFSSHERHSLRAKRAARKEGRRTANWRQTAASPIRLLLGTEPTR